MHLFVAIVPIFIGVQVLPSAEDIESHWLRKHITCYGLQTLRSSKSLHEIDPSLVELNVKFQSKRDALFLILDSNIGTRGLARSMHDSIHQKNGFIPKKETRSEVAVGSEKLPKHVGARELG